jgi:predicted nucleotidyltransferase
MTAPFSESPPVPASSSVIDLARAFVEEHHPYASASVLGGSAAAGTATSTSDLDIAVLYPNGHSNYAATTRYCGWLVEEFVHTEESLDSWYQKEAVERRPVIADLCARGILLTDNGAGAEWQTRAREQMARGPMALGDGERDLRRYNLSALIDDLMGSRDAAETFALASGVFHETADLFLMESGSWLGDGKWIVRRLRLNGSDLALRLCNWAGDPVRSAASLVELGREVLEFSGGYLQEGFLRGKRA